MGSFNPDRISTGRLKGQGSVELGAAAPWAKEDCARQRFRMQQEERPRRCSRRSSSPAPGPSEAVERRASATKAASSPARRRTSSSSNRPSRKRRKKRGMSPSSTFPRGERRRRPAQSPGRAKRGRFRRRPCHEEGEQAEGLGRRRAQSDEHRPAGAITGFRGASGMRGSSHRLIELRQRGFDRRAAAFQERRQFQRFPNDRAAHRWRSRADRWRFRTAHRRARGNRPSESSCGPSARSFANDESWASLRTIAACSASSATRNAM